MADLKISQLTSATLPLAGTEVLPIVQSSSTKKVATDDLTVKNVRSNATTGILQIAGPGAGTTRTMTTPNANFTAARTDAAQSFTGDQTLGTGNLIQGTAAKGVNFTANTSAAGMTSQLLNWYEEGTFTPTLTCSTVGNLSVSYSIQLGRYTRIGNRVIINATIVTSAFTHTTASGGVRLSGLPFNSNGTAANYPVLSLWFSGITKVGYTQLTPYPDPGTNFLLVNASGSGVSSTGVLITDLPTGGNVVMIYSGEYMI